MTPATDVRDRLDAQAVDERRRASRALLVRPLVLAADAPDTHRLIRRHAAALKDWFASALGWALTVDADAARLRKTPPRNDDATRPARARRGDPPFSRRRYVLVCVALAQLETGERQITLGQLAEQTRGALAADPTLVGAGMGLDLTNRDHRRDLVATVRLLIGYGALRRVDGDETAYVSGDGDVLYTIERSVLATLLAARRPPSTIDAEELDERLDALVAEPVADTHDARNTALRIHLTRRLVEEPMVYYDELTHGELDYLHRQRARILRSIEDATGLVAEVRAEGIAMVDDRGDCTDLKMPDQGTDGHLTLLVAEHLADRLRRGGGAVPTSELESLVARLIAEHADHWRRDVREPGAETQLAEEALERLEALHLVRRDGDATRPRPAIARYATAAPSVAGGQPTLLDGGKETP